MRERTILIGGFSKAYAMTGWRVGYACAPKEILEGIVKVHQYEIMSAPTTAQDAAVVALHAAEPDVERDGPASTTAAAGCSWPGSTRSACRRPSRRVPSTPSRRSADRPDQRGVQRAAAVRGARRGGSGLGVRAIGGGPRPRHLGHLVRGSRGGPGPDRPVRRAEVTRKRRRRPAATRGAGGSRAAGRPVRRR